MRNINQTLVTFILGLLIGIYLAFYIKSRNTALPIRINPAFVDLPKKIPQFNTHYDNSFKSKGYTRRKVSIDTLRYGNDVFRTEAQVLQENIKILCVILSNNDKTAKAGVNTWAKGCNNVVVIQLGNKRAKHKLPVRKTAENSNWNKLCEAIQAIDDQYQWVIFVHQQTFVLLENLRWFVASLDFNANYYLGEAQSFWHVKYNLAQAGFALSQGSIRVLKEEFTEMGCEVKNIMINKADFTLGAILSKYAIFPIDTRDPDGYSTFNAFNWQQEFFPGVNYYKNSIYPRKCCSSRVITFKGIEQDKFYMYQYLLYQLDVFHGGNLGNKPMTTPKDKDFVWKQFLAEHGVYRNVSAQEYYKIWSESGFNPEMFNTFENNYD